MDWIEYFMLLLFISFPTARNFHQGSESAQLPDQLPRHEPLPGTCPGTKNKFQSVRRQRIWIPVREGAGVAVTTPAKEFALTGCPEKLHRSAGGASSSPPLSNTKSLPGSRRIV